MCKTWQLHCGGPYLSLFTYKHLVFILVDFTYVSFYLLFLNFSKFFWKKKAKLKHLKGKVRLRARPPRVLAYISGYICFEMILSQFFLKIPRMCIYTTTIFLGSNICIFLMFLPRLEVEPLFWLDSLRVFMQIRVVDMSNHKQKSIL